MRQLKHLGILVIIIAIHSCNSSTNVDKYKTVTKIVSTPIEIQKTEKDSIYHFKIAENIKSDSFLIKSRLKVQNKRFELRINNLVIFANPKKMISFFKYKDGKRLPPPHDYTVMIFDNYPFIFNRFFNLEIIGEKDLITIKFNDKKVLDIVKESTDRPLSIKLIDHGCNIEFRYITIHE